MGGIYKIFEECIPNEKHKKLIVCDDMNAAMLSNKKEMNLIVCQLFIRVRKLNISFVFITQSYFAVPKNITAKNVVSKCDQIRSFLWIR